jgi:hypothetical protein
MSLDYGLVPPFSRSEVLFISDLQRPARLSHAAAPAQPAHLVPAGAGVSGTACFATSRRDERGWAFTICAVWWTKPLAIYNFNCWKASARPAEAERANNLKLKFWR